MSSTNKSVIHWIACAARMVFLQAFIACTLLACSSGDGVTNRGSAPVEATATCPTPSVECTTGCANLESDFENCGACGAICAEGLVCDRGACTTQCSASRTNCSGSCVDPSSDLKHCGLCGVACSSGQECIEGSCRDTMTEPDPIDGTGGNADGRCGAGESECDGVCIDTSTDAANCGECGTVCGTGMTCDAGACACANGQTSCSNSCTDTQSDLGNCGMCGNACEVDFTCQTGVCVAGGNYVPWEIAAATSYASVAESPDGIIIPDDVHAALADEAAKSVAADGEMIGGLILANGLLQVSSNTVDPGVVSIWHTHLWDTAFSYADVSGWLSGVGGIDFQFETVRGIANITYVGMRTAQTSEGLDESTVGAEATQLRDDIGSVMSDQEASHWAIFELSRRYNFAYYFAGPDSQLMLRVTTEGPSNVEDPSGYPQSVLGAP